MFQNPERTVSIELLPADRGAARQRYWLRGALGRLWNSHSGAALLVLIFVLLLPVSNPRVYAVDEVQYYAYLRSLYFDGDLDFENEYLSFDATNALPAEVHDNPDPRDKLVPCFLRRSDRARHRAHHRTIVASAGDD